ncbi:MAG: hypothetical protein KGJ11_00900 [Candidatus Omnitrophica bacterium]|nr:hypothetical protein [Candidatus Omnitrophota bacterium]
MDGKEISHFFTLKSIYDNNSIGAYVKGQTYRIHVSTILEMARGVEFVPVKKKVHTYLEIAKKGEEHVC